MAKQRRREEKKRRRKKRQEKQVAKNPTQETPPDRRFLGERIEPNVPEEPEIFFPGACDETLQQPDSVLKDLSRYALELPPGSSKCKRFVKAIEKGPLSFLQETELWAAEEFLYHGSPNDDWDPIEAFLTSPQGARLSPAAKDQVRLWKQARIAMYLIEEVREDTMTLRQWDITDGSLGPKFEAIALNIGGVQVHEESLNEILLSYVSPWVPDENLYCVMGYSVVFPQGEADYFAFYLWLQHPELLVDPYPWEEPAAAREYHNVWENRDWYTWLNEKLTFPFAAVVAGVAIEPQVQEMTGIVQTSPEEARDFGIYITFGGWGRKTEIGAMAVIPLDIASNNFKVLAEYHAYRRWAGPPPRVAEMMEDEE